MGQHPEKAVRSCLLATGHGRAVGLTEQELRDVYLASLLRHVSLGLSSGTSELAELAGREIGLDDPAVGDLRRAALLHDLGRGGVSSGTWDKPGALTRSELEQVRLHPHDTERILACSRRCSPHWAAHPPERAAERPWPRGRGQDGSTPTVCEP